MSNTIDGLQPKSVKHRSNVWESNFYGYQVVFYLANINIGAIILSLMLKTSTETVAELAQRAKSMRLAQNLTQAGLEQRSGVSLGSIKLFERTGKISFESLVKIAIALGASEGFDGLFQPNLTENRSIDDLLKDAKASTGRKRGRVR